MFIVFLIHKIKIGPTSEVEPFGRSVNVLSIFYIEILKNIRSKF